MKECFKCGIVKPLSEFYEHKAMKDGHLNKCKECNKKDVQKNYRAKIDYYKDYEQVRNQKRKDYIRKKNKEYQEKNKDRIFKDKKKWQTNNKEKRAAHVIFGNALRDGKIKKGLCQICGSKETEGHHFDYTKPLNVIWLCKTHHVKVHWWLRRNKRKYNK